MRWNPNHPELVGLDWLPGESVARLTGFNGETVDVATIVGDHAPLWIKRPVLVQPYDGTYRTETFVAIGDGTYRRVS